MADLPGNSVFLQHAKEQTWEFRCLGHPTVGCEWVLTGHSPFPDRAVYKAFRGHWKANHETKGTS